MTEVSLCARKTADTGVCPAPGAALLEARPVRLVLALIYHLSQALEEEPLLFHAVGDRCVTALFRGSRCVCTDFLDSYGPIMAALDGRWPVSVYGTAEGAEVGLLRAEPDCGRARWTEETASGRAFGALDDLCVQVEAPTGDEAATLAEILSGLSVRAGCIAATRRHEDFFSGDNLAQVWPGAHFIYLDLAGDLTDGERLDSLSMAQKELLWEEYLGEGVSALEFQWLWEDYAAGAARALPEWELALRAALAGLGVRVENGAEGFKVTGVEGRFRLDFITAPAAGKLFLKILFPA